MCLVRKTMRFIRISVFLVYFLVGSRHILRFVPDRLMCLSVPGISRWHIFPWYKTEFARCNNFNARRYAIFQPRIVPEGHELDISWCLAATVRQGPKCVWVTKTEGLGNKPNVIITNKM
jgi:hypothetical protein